MPYFSVLAEQGVDVAAPYADVLQHPVAELVQLAPGAPARQDSVMRE